MRSFEDYKRKALKKRAIRVEYNKLMQKGGVVEH